MTHVTTLRPALPNQISTAGSLLKSTGGSVLASPKFRPPPVRFCADYENESRIPQLLLHPKNPAFHGKALILVKRRIDTVTAETVCQHEDVVFVRT
jgi:hypothetical protein